MDQYLTQQCAILADQNIHIDAETLYEMQPEDDRRYSVEQIQQWLDQHPRYAQGNY